MSRAGGAASGDAPLNSPRSVTSDDGPPIGGRCTAMISMSPTSPDIVAFCQSLRRRLLLGGVQCTVPQTSEIGGTAWRRELIRFLKRSSVFICIVTSDWLRSGVSMIALYYALRRSYVCSTPIVIPIIMQDVVGRGSPLVDAMQKQCFHIVHQGQAAMIDELVVKIRSFMKALQFDVSQHTVQDGMNFSEIYSHHHNAILGKPPRKALLTLIKSLPEDVTELSLAADATKVPPTAYYLGDNGLKPLIEVVRLLPNLRSLNLRGNGITNNSMHLLTQALLLHPSLTSLDVGDNEGISQAGAAELYYLARCNEQVVDLKVDGTSVCSAVWSKRIGAQLERNRGSSFGAWAQLRTDNTEPFGIAGTPYVELDVKSAVFWQVVVTCTPTDALMAPSMWTCDTAAVSAVVSASSDGAVFEHREKLTGVEKEQALHYFKLVDQNTCCMKKTNGATIKLVLEQEGSGMELLQQVLRTRASQEGVWPQRLLLGLQKVAVRAVCDRPLRCKPSSFFVEADMWYRGDKQIAKDTPQLFSEDIAKYTGSIWHEIISLMERIYDDDLVLDDERQALADIEEEEDLQIQAAEEEEMERVVSYWKSNTQMYRQRTDDQFLHKIRELKQRKQDITATERNAHDDSCAVKLATIEERHCRACIGTPDYPPYNY